MRLPLKGIFPYILLLLFFASAVLLRPLLPVDETRYMTVAWEMYLNKNYFLPTMNFAPYHHKPPMLFWLINLVWNIFGVSRWAGLVPIFAAAAAVMALTQKLAAHLFPNNKTIIQNIPWMILGSFPFLLYSTLVMFDLMVTAIVLSVILIFLDHIQNPRWYKIFAAGFLIGAGVLTKGPVAYLYVLSPLLLYPFWKDAQDRLSTKKYYIALGFSLLLSILPVAAWLVPALSHANADFAFWLVWEQTAGRITGNFSAAHVRPFYFYLILLPVLFLPWILFPSVWRNLRALPYKHPSYKFLAAATIPALICFCLISGKQPHYILPLLPYVIIAIAGLSQSPHPSIITTAVTLLLLTIGGQAYASRTFFEHYNMVPIAEYYAQHKDRDWGFIRNYQGQIGFLARAAKPMDNLQIENIDTWMQDHPKGYVIIRYNPLKENMDKYNIVLKIPHREKMLAVVQEKN